MSDFDPFPLLECPFVIRRPQELREALRAVASEA
jgi:hypothetical protein